MLQKSRARDDFAARFVRFFLVTEVREWGPMLKKFKDLTEKEILAIAIAAEEEDGRIYGEFADALREEYQSTADMFEEMREEAGGSDGDGGEPLLRASSEQDGRCINAGIVEQARGRGEKAQTDCRRAGRKTSNGERESPGGRITQEIVSAAGGAAGFGWIDGWLGFDAGANFCRGIRFAKELGSLPGGTCSFHRRGHFDGIFRRAFR